MANKFNSRKWFQVFLIGACLAIAFLSVTDLQAAEVGPPGQIVLSQVIIKETGKLPSPLPAPMQPQFFPLKPGSSSLPQPKPLTRAPVGVGLPIPSQSRGMMTETLSMPGRTTFVYDNLNRLIWAVYDQATFTYSYDETGNRLTKKVTRAKPFRDFDGDGRTDILWRHNSGDVAIWFMDGTSVSSIGGPGTASSDWQINGVGDFDGDRKADIFWQNTSTGWTNIWFMDGAAILNTAAPGLVSDLNWQVKGIGDFNGDGKADVLWRNNVDGSLVIWLMNGTAIASTVSPGAVSDLNWQIKGVGDFNGDGNADILWRYTTDGSVAIWLMDGATISSIGGPGAVSNDWQIIEK